MSTEAPPAKRPRTEEQQPDDDAAYHTNPELFLLQKQNKVLKGRFSEYKNTISQLEAHVARLQKNQANYDAHLDVIGSAWDSLDTDLQAVLSRVSPESLKFNWPKVGDEVKAGSLLARLMQADSDKSGDVKMKEEGKEEGEESDNNEEEDDQQWVALPSDEVQAALSKRTAWTKDILSKVVGGLEASSARINELASALTSEDADIRTNSTVTALQADNKSLRSSSNSMQTAMDNLQVHIKSTTNAKNTFQKSHVELQRKVKELSDQLYDAQELNKTLQRQLERAKTAAPAQTNGSTSTTSGQGSGDASDGKSGQAGGSAGTDKGGASTEAVTKLQTQIKDLQASLTDVETTSASRLAEIEGLRTERRGMVERLAALEAKERGGISNDDVLKSPYYSNMHGRLVMVEEELKASRQQVTTLQEQLNECQMARSRDLSTLEASCLHAEGLFRHTLNENTLAMQNLNTELGVARARLQQYDAADKERAGVTKEVTRLREAVKQVQADTAAQRDAMRQATLAANARRDRWDSLIADLDQGGQEREKQLVFLQSEMQRLKARDEEVTKKEQEWQAKKADLETLLSASQSANADKRELTEVRAAEQKVQRELEQVRQQLSELKAAQGGEDPPAMVALRKELAIAQDALKKEKESHAEHEADSEALMGEIESLSTGFDDLTDQNARLLKQLDESTTNNARLLREKMRYQQKDAISAELRTSYEQQLNALRQSLAKAEEMVRLADQRTKAAGETAERIGHEVHQSVQLREQHKVAATQNYNTLATVKSELTDAQSSLEKIRGSQDNNAVALEDAKSDLARAKEENASLKRKYERAKSKLADSSGGGDANMESELRQYRKLFKCNVCRVRTKEMVITKCGHMLCGQCLRKNLETRHRKCPSCGKSFGQDDAKNIYF